MKRLVAVLALAMLATACDVSRDRGSRGASASASAAAAPSQAPPVRGRKWFVPTGPRLAILPGEGLGPIRLGASVETVERLMELPCDEKTPTLCRYVTRAVDFHLSDGKVEEATVHRKDRPAGKDRSGQQRQFGVFNGAMLMRRIVPGMLRHEIIDAMGEGSLGERVVDDRGYGTIEIRKFDGLRVEFDDVGERGVVIGALIVTRKAATDG